MMIIYIAIKRQLFVEKSIFRYIEKFNIEISIFKKYAPVYIDISQQPSINTYRDTISYNSIWHFSVYQPLISRSLKIVQSLELLQVLMTLV